MLVEIIKDDEGCPILLEDGKRVDSHTIATSRGDYIGKSAYMLFRRYGWGCKGKLTGPAEDCKEIDAELHEKYFTINGEDASKYVIHLPPSLANLNCRIARLHGYEYYKELIKAGFTEYFSATTAYNYGLLLANPDKEEIFDILGIKSKTNY